MFILLATFILFYEFGDVLLYSFKMAVLLDGFNYIDNPAMFIF